MTGGARASRVQGRKVISSALRRTPAPPAAVLGLGKAGGALLASLEDAGVEVVARARRVGGLLRCARLDEASILFLAVPDRALDEVCRVLARRLAARARAPLAVHLAGARGLDVLAPLEGCARVGSFHPLASLDGKHPIPRGTLLAWDAERAADGRTLAGLARRMGLEPTRVRDAQRTRYHAGAVVAGNLPVALLALGVCLLTEAGVPAATARKSLARLLRSQAESAATRPLDAALTGPIARGDVATLERHLELLDGSSPEVAELYRALSRVLVDDVTRHPARLKRRLQAALEA